MEALIESIVKPIVDHPELIRVCKEVSKGKVIYRLEVHPEDAGKIIGKNGRIAKAIRTLVHAKAAPGESVYLDIM